jgi:deazaflavin-dependent oxidoreductase (nitroreductase family)
MPEKIREPRPPSGLGRIFFRLPILLYRVGLGGLLGKRMLLLNHVGRKSGLPRQAVLEVVHHDEGTGTYVVNAGFGEKSQWYQNLLVNPEATIQVGRRVMPVRAERLQPKDGGEVFLNFARAHPFEARFVGALGYRVDGTDADWRAVGEELLFVSLKPRVT